VERWGKISLLSLFTKEGRQCPGTYQDGVWIPAFAGMTSSFLFSFYQLDEDILGGGGVDKDNPGIRELHWILILEFFALCF